MWVLLLNVLNSQLIDIFRYSENFLINGFLNFDPLTGYFIIDHTTPFIFTVYIFIIKCNSYLLSHIQ